MKRKVLFFYPAENIGGVQVLFARLGQLLSKNNFEIISADFGKSFISNFFEKEGLNFEHLIVDEKALVKASIPGGCIVVVTLSYVIEINKYFSFPENARILLWDTHPYNLIEHTSFSYFYKNLHIKPVVNFLKMLEGTRLEKIKKFLNKANLKQSLFFMCYRNFLTNKYFFNLDFEAKYLPLPIPLADCNDDCNRQNRKSENIINIGWLSRLEIDKIRILNLLISDLELYASLNKELKIYLHIIGVGSASDNISKPKNIIIVDVGKKFDKELSLYARKKLDLSFAMGTAALYFAALGIPSVLVPSSTLYHQYKSIEKKYMWLYKIKGFDVATELFHTEALDIKGVLSDLKFHGKELLSERCESYVSCNHSIDKVGESMIEKVESCQLTYSDIKATGVYNLSLTDRIFYGFKGIAKNIKDKL